MLHKNTQHALKRHDVSIQFPSQHIVDWRDTLPNALTDDWIKYECPEPLICYKLIDGRDVQFYRGQPKIFEDGLWQEPEPSFPVDALFLQTFEKMKAAGVVFHNQSYTLTGPGVTSSRGLTNPYRLKKCVLIESRKFRLFEYDPGTIQDYLSENASRAGVLCFNGWNEAIVFNADFSDKADLLA